ncbi:MAG: T9SS type A sorting domain-containing protein [Crocinitomicaceae bacterium]|nr:T9SS type A sorting domain-containing protein [Crocinitomicaceae bacterium]
MKGLTIISLLISTLSLGQVNNTTWGVDDTILVISKTTDFGPVHDYIEVFNNAGQDLQMRWVYHEPASWPTLWETNFTDLENNYYDLQHLDSADFTLLNPPGWSNKLIIGVQHFSFAHTDTIKFKVWPIGFPEDSLWLYYVIEIAQGNAWAGIAEEQQEIDYWLDQSSRQFMFMEDVGTVDISVYDLTGRLVKRVNAFQAISHSVLDFSGLRNGTYIVDIADPLSGAHSIKVNLR